LDYFEVCYNMQLEIIIIPSLMETFGSALMGRSLDFPGSLTAQKTNPQSSSAVLGPQGSFIILMTSDGEVENTISQAVQSLSGLRHPAELNPTMNVCLFKCACATHNLTLRISLRRSIRQIGPVL